MMAKMLEALMAQKNEIIDNIDCGDIINKGVEAEESKIIGIGDGVEKIINIEKKEKNIWCVWYKG